MFFSLSLSLSAPPLYSLQNPKPPPNDHLFVESSNKDWRKKVLS